MTGNGFPIDVGGGEMWLSSDILLNQFGGDSGGGFESLRRSHRSPCSCMTVDSLSDQLSLMSLLRPKPRAIPRMPMSLEPSRLQVCCSANRSVCDVIGGGSEVGRRMYSGGRFKAPLGATETFYQLRLPRTAPTEVEMLYLQQARARALQKQQTWLQSQNRGLVQRNVSKTCGSARESAGTGVFHPRNLHECGADSANSLKNRDSANSLKNRAPKNRQQTKNEMTTTTLHRNLMRREAIALKQQDDCYYHLPSDIDFSEF